jgi:hypothetical protein
LDIERPARGGPLERYGDVGDDCVMTPISFGDARAPSAQSAWVD